jgi:hypothetical protein
MAAGRVIISDVQIDNYVPQSILCAHCSGEVDLTKAHYGRAMMGFKTSQSHSVVHTLYNGEIHAIPTIEDKWFPVKTKGFYCDDCYTLLWNITWRDKTGHLKHAFESTPIPGPIEQPKGDDYEAAKVTKGLYAPHVVKHSHGRKADYFETPQSSGSSPVIDEASLPRNPVNDRKLQGFNRPIRDDIKLKPKRIVVRKGKWKEDPTEYDYRSSK